MTPGYKITNVTDRTLWALSIRLRPGESTITTDPLPGEVENWVKGSAPFLSATPVDLDTGEEVASGQPADETAADEEEEAEPAPEAVAEPEPEPEAEAEPEAEPEEAVAEEEEASDPLYSGLGGYEG